MNIIKGALEALLEDLGITFHRELFAAHYPDAIAHARGAARIPARKPAGANAPKAQTFADLYAQDEHADVPSVVLRSRGVIGIGRGAVPSTLAALADPFLRGDTFERREVNRTQGTRYCANFI